MKNLIALLLPGDYSVRSPHTEEGLFSAHLPDTINLGGIISALLPYVFALAGLVLFIFLIIGGFGLLISGGSPDKMKAAQGKITSAVIGFVIIFISYWLMRILEIVFGISILG